jgi:hypothetical protein
VRAPLLAVLGLCLACRSAATPPPRTVGACPYEENCGCPVPGIADRGRAAYFMFASGTDDFLNEDVQACFRRTAGQPVAPSAGLTPALAMMTAHAEPNGAASRK